MTEDEKTSVYIESEIRRTLLDIGESLRAAHGGRGGLSRAVRFLVMDWLRTPAENRVARIASAAGRDS